MTTDKDKMKWFTTGVTNCFAKIKSQPNGENWVILTGLNQNMPEWSRAIQQGFKPSKSFRNLILPMPPGVNLKAQTIRHIFPNSKSALVRIDLVRLHNRQDHQTAASIRESQILGLNFAYEEVYEGAAGRYVIDSQGRNVPQSADRMNFARFLLAPSPAHYALCLEGLVNSMENNTAVRLGDLQRYLPLLENTQATEPLAAQDPRVIKALSDLRETVQKRVLALGRADDRAYKFAVKLTENRPSALPGLGPSAHPYSQVLLPVALSCQNILGDLSAQKILSIDPQEGDLIAFLPSQGQVYTVNQTDEFIDSLSLIRPEATNRVGDFLKIAPKPIFDKVIARFDNSDRSNEPGLNNEPISAPSVEKSWQAKVLRSLEHRKPGGVSVFLVPSRVSPKSLVNEGRLDPHLQSFYKDLGDQYEILSLCEISTALTKKDGQEDPTSLLVIGTKNAPELVDTRKQSACLYLNGQAIDLTENEHPLPVFSDYLSIWQHSQKIRQIAQNKIEEFALANQSWQPENLLQPQRQNQPRPGNEESQEEGGEQIGPAMPRPANPPSQTRPEPEENESSSSPNEKSDEVHDLSLNAQRKQNEAQGGLENNEPGTTKTDEQSQPPESREDFLKRKRLELNEFQAPYEPRSKLGECEAMIPRNLMAATNYAFDRYLNRVKCSVDEYVCKQLKTTPAKLAQLYDPAQIDWLFLALNKFNEKAGIINSDATGFGKGREISGMIGHAVRNGKVVVFLTKNAGLFSDIWRDFVNTEIDKDVRPFILNAGAQIFSTDNTVAVPPTSAKERKRVITSVLEDNASFGDLGYNLVMASYSQFNTFNNERAKFLKALCEQNEVYLVMDESHESSGASNIQLNLIEPVRKADAVLYSSATYAKGEQNMGIYQRVLPDNTNASLLTDVLKAGGAPALENFSEMLARDGSLIKREQDTSRVCYEVYEDKDNHARNQKWADENALILRAALGLSTVVQKSLLPIIRKAWMSLQELNKAQAGMKTSNKGPETVRYTHFSARSFGLTRQFVLSTKCDAVVQAATADVLSGKKPLIFMDITNETAIKEFASDFSPQSPPSEVQPSAQSGSLFDAPGSAPQTPEAPALNLFSDDDEPVEELAWGGTQDLQVDGEMQNSEYAENALATRIEKSDKQKGKSRQNQQTVVEMPLMGYPDLLQRAIERSLRVKFVDYLNQKQVYSVLDDQCIAHLDEDQLKRALPILQDIQDRLEKIKVQIESFKNGSSIPISPIDYIRQKIENSLTNAEPNNISTGEISGRSTRLIELEDGKTMRFIQETPNRQKTAFEFNHGGIDVAAVTLPATTGFTFSDDQTFGRTGQAVLHKTSIPLDTNVDTQVDGRVNRKGQRTDPLIRLYKTGIYAEDRLLAMANAKTKRRTSLTNSNRSSSHEIENVPDILNHFGNKIVAEALMEMPEIAQMVGIDSDVLIDALQAPESNFDCHIVNALFARMALLTQSEAEKVTTRIYAEYNTQLEHLNAIGKNPFKASEMEVNATLVERIPTPFIGTIQEEYASAFDEPAFLHRYEWTVYKDPLRWDEVERRYQSSLQSIQDQTGIEFVDIHQCRKNRVSILSETLTNPPGLSNHLERIRDAAKQKMEALLEISTRYDSIEQALTASEETNFFKNIQQRVLWIEKILPWLRPGALISHSNLFDPDDQGSLHSMIVSCLIPTEPSEMVNLGQYRLEVIRPGMSCTESMSLHTLYKDTQFNQAASFHGVSVWQLVEAFAQAKREEQKVSQLFLTGNIYKAAEFSSNNNLGKTVLLHTAQKEIIRSVMLPKKTKLEDVLNTSIELPLTKHVKAFMRRQLVDFRSSTSPVHEGGFVYLNDENIHKSNDRIKDNSVMLRATNADNTGDHHHVQTVHLSVPKLKRYSEPLLAHPDFETILKSCDSHKKDQDSSRESFALRGVSLENLNRLVDLIYSEMGIRFRIKGAFRDFANEIIYGKATDSQDSASEQKSAEPANSDPSSSALDDWGSDETPTRHVA